MKKILSRKVLFIVVLVLILTLASLSTFASTPLAESMINHVYLPFIDNQPPCASIPC